MMRRAKFLLVLAVVLPLSLPARGAQSKIGGFCTKEVCSAARADCRAWCPFPCTMVFECNYPSCGSCISCTC